MAQHCAHSEQCPSASVPYGLYCTASTAALYPVLPAHIQARMPVRAQRHRAWPLCAGMAARELHTTADRRQALRLRVAELLDVFIRVNSKSALVLELVRQL